MNGARLSAGLPEHFARLYDQNSEKFITPLDSRGIADADAVFELAVRTFPGDLSRALRANRDIHHLYRTEREWLDLARQQNNQFDYFTVLRFRDGTPQKMYVPRPIHQWIEHSQMPPPAPSLEVMRRRNAAWTSAAILLRSCIDLDKARDQYKNKRGKIRWTLGRIPGITPPHRQSDSDYVFKVDDEYWLSELNKRLEGWQQLSAENGQLPVEEGIIETPRLYEVRRLHRRVLPGAIVPRIPHIPTIA